MGSYRTDELSISDKADIASFRETEPYEGQDWNARLGMPATLPTDRMVWIVTEEGDVHEVAHNSEHAFWMREDAWYRQDGEPGHWTRDEIAGWSDSYEDAEQAAAELEQYFGGGK